MGLNGSYGAVLGSVIGFSISILIAMLVLRDKYGFSFHDTVKRIPNYIISYILFVITILIIKLVVPTNLDSRLLQIPILILFGLVSFAIYIFVNYKNGNLEDVFGEVINKFKKRLLKR